MVHQVAGVITPTAGDQYRLPGQGNRLDELAVLEGEPRFATKSLGRSRFGNPVRRLAQQRDEGGLRAVEIFAQTFN
jgi:hypothetical protein